MQDTAYYVPRCPYIRRRLETSQRVKSTPPAGPAGAQPLAPSRLTSVPQALARSLLKSLPIPSRDFIFASSPRNTILGA